MLEAGGRRTPRAHARMLTPREVGELAPIPTDDVVGGFHATLDLRVDPRAAVAGLRGPARPRTTARGSNGATHVHEVEAGSVHAGRLEVRAPAIVVCPGPDYRSLPPALRRGLEPLTLCTAADAAAGGARPGVATSRRSRPGSA